MKGLSCVMGNYHAQFLGGLGSAMTPGYPVLAILHVFSINRNRGDIWFFIGDICKIHFSSTPQYLVYPLI
jgi:hypothetical protein